LWRDSEFVAFVVKLFISLETSGFSFNMKHSHTISHDINVTIPSLSASLK